MTNCLSLSDVSDSDLEGAPNDAIDPESLFAKIERNSLDRRLAHSSSDDDIIEAEDAYDDAIFGREMPEEA